MDQGEVVDVIYLDFPKAFDTVPHERLLLKMRGYGVEGKVLEWTAGFPRQRRQLVRVAGTDSVFIVETL